MRHFSEQEIGKIRTLTEWLTLVAGIILLVVLTRELIEQNRPHFSEFYLQVQLGVCVIFIADLIVRLLASENRRRFVLHNALFFLLSVPFLNIIYVLDIELPRTVTMLVGAVPLLRILVVADTLSRWLTRGRAQHIAAAYAMMTLLFTYISALVFYDYEVGRNTRLDSFGDAVWWAFMNLTTVGAEIFPVTTIGKILAVLLPTMGMLILPIFTAYVTAIFAHGAKR
ncbi:MAG: two pore domain potassium channel family protein [Alistipes sp.]|nr:two pore domain potassium channel family protein [Alistipes sp.]